MKRTHLLALFIFSCNALLAQQQIDTSSIAYNNTVNYYRKTIAESSLLYNGSLYQKFPLPSEGHVFYDTEEWQTGYVLYDGIQYPVRLKYDIVKDAVLIPSYSNNFQIIELVKPKVSGFGWEGHSFVNITDSVPGLHMGVYEKLYDGKITFLAKNVKTRHEDLSKEIHYSYSQNVSYYLRKDSAFIYVSTINGILSVLDDKKRELQQYLKQNKIRFRQDKEYAIRMIGAYYDKLTTTNR